MLMNVNMLYLLLSSNKCSFIKNSKNTVEPVITVTLTQRPPPINARQKLNPIVSLVKLAQEKLQKITSFLLSF